MKCFSICIFAGLFLLTLAPRAIAAGGWAALPEGTVVRRDVAYVKNVGPRQTLDLYLPPIDKKHPDAPRPLVVWIHGGGWEAGDKANAPAAALLRQGYAVASIDYRLSQDAVWPAQIQDCRAAVRFLRATAADNKIDPDRIGAWGASAGGHLALLLGMEPDHPAWDTPGTERADVSPAVRCVLDWFGPTDLPALLGPGDARNPVVRLLGKPDRKLAADASPITYVSKNVAPILILHGDRDPLVPLDQSRRLSAALRRAGATCTLLILPGARHGGEEFVRPRYLLAEVAFFRKYLAGPGEPSSRPTNP